MSRKKSSNGGGAKQARRQQHGKGVVVPPRLQKPQGRWIMVVDSRGRRRMVQERPNG